MICPIIIPLVVITIMKFVGAIICRFILDKFYKEDFTYDN